LAFYIAYILFGIVLSLYGLLFELSTGHHNRLLLIYFMVFMTVLFALQFYILCSKADCIMSIVSY